jgi:DNA-binding transcriptional LysR family regulator
MNLRSVDLNLLIALDALLSEQHVSRAAQRVGLTQPAMSNALGRLRRLFRDDLLIRTASGMRPTRQAEILREPLKQALRQVERVFDRGASFDPTTAAATLALRMSDLLGYMILPPLLAEISRIAPGLGLDILHLSPQQTVDALERDEIHAAVSMSLDHSGSIRSEPLMQDRMVCVMRRGHPLSHGELTMDAFLAASHLKVSMSPSDRRFVDDILRREGLERRVVLNVPHWLLVPRILGASDLISVMPGRFAAALADADLVRREAPFASESFDWRLYRHRRYDADGAVEWLCERLRNVCAALA